MIIYTRTDDGWTGIDRSDEEPTTVAVDKKDEAELEALYDLHRPDTADGDDYQLISMDVVNGSGILNCRVNGEHIQVRF
jgi:hypothetical protein